jgi:hypothetical protein
MIGLAVLAAVEAADAASTRAALRTPGAHEMNPLVQNTDALIGLKIAGIGLAAALTYECQRAGHYRLARWMGPLVAAPQAAAAIHNYALVRK